MAIVPRMGIVGPEYKAWWAARHRCTNPSNPWYHRYGGRGISMCDRWKTSYANFLEDMGRRPTPQHTLDRTNNDGPYSKENCRWATWREQHLNKTLSRPRMDLTGTRFGRLIAIEALPRLPKIVTRWRCRCDCGAVIVTGIGKLRSGLAQSCGCLRRERTIASNQHRRHLPHVQP